MIRPRERAWGQLREGRVTEPTGAVPHGAGSPNSATPMPSRPSLQYQPARDGRWGDVVYGNRRVSVRNLVFVGGALAWVLVTMLATGDDALVALWTNALFLAALVALGTLTRTVTLRWVVVFVLLGGALMSATIVLAGIVDLFIRDTNDPLRAFIVPLLEEALKFLPVVGLLWWARRGGTWAVGATDVLLLAAASGVGYGFVEDAWIRAESGWPGQLDWLPVTEIIGDHLIAGHAIWTAIAGAVAGLVLLLRGRIPAAGVVALGALGFLWAVLDHTANNYGAGHSGALADMLQVVTADGWLSVWLFVALSVAVLAVDAWLLYARARLPLVPPAGGSVSLADRWDTALEARAGAFAAFRASAARRRSPNDGRPSEPRLVADAYAESLRLRVATPLVAAQPSVVTPGGAGPA